MRRWSIKARRSAQPEWQDSREVRALSGRVRQTSLRPSLEPTLQESHCSFSDWWCSWMRLPQQGDADSRQIDLKIFDTVEIIVGCANSVKDIPPAIRGSLTKPKKPTRASAFDDPDGPHPGDLAGEVGVVDGVHHVVHVLVRLRLLFRQPAATRGHRNDAASFQLLVDFAASAI